MFNNTQFLYRYGSNTRFGVATNIEYTDGCLSFDFEKQRYRTQASLGVFHTLYHGKALNLCDVVTLPCRAI